LRVDGRARFKVTEQPVDAQMAVGCSGWTGPARTA